MIEKILDEFIVDLVLNHDKYNSDDYTFAKKYQLVQMLGLDDCLNNEIKSLNKLCNQLAHQTEDVNETLMKNIFDEINHKAPGTCNADTML